jgi:hypothetical protein
MITEWEHKIIDQNLGEPPADILMLNNGVSMIIIKYERFHNFVYNEMLRDYVFKYTPSIEFLTTKNYLLRNRKHCKITV